MWMEGFDLSPLGNESGIGINESRCAMVLKEKTALYQGLLDIMDFIEDAEGLPDEEFFQVIEEKSTRKPPKKVQHGDEDLFLYTSKTPRITTAGKAPSQSTTVKQRRKTK